MIRFETQYSTYIVDEENKKITRLESTHAPTPRQGEDGEWKEYTDLHIFKSGVMIVWGYDNGMARTTMTSPLTMVTTIEELPA